MLLMVAWACTYFENMVMGINNNSEWAELA